jgi:hypothetical protein
VEEFAIVKALLCTSRRKPKHPSCRSGASFSPQSGGPYCFCTCIRPTMPLRVCGRIGDRICNGEVSEHTCGKSPTTVRIGDLSQVHGDLKEVLISKLRVLSIYEPCSWGAQCRLLKPTNTHVSMADIRLSPSPQSMNN